MIVMALLLWFALSIPAVLIVGPMIAISSRGTDWPTPAQRIVMPRPRVCR
jgi:hypothetical protein